MKVVYTDEALAELEAISAYIAAHYPASYADFVRRLKTIEVRIGTWPESAQRIAQRMDIRVVPLIRYPYRIFIALKTMRWKLFTSITPRAVSPADFTNLANHAR